MKQFRVTNPKNDQHPLDILEEFVGVIFTASEDPMLRRDVVTAIEAGDIPREGAEGCIVPIEDLIDTLRGHGRHQAADYWRVWSERHPSPWILFLPSECEVLEDAPR